MKTIGTMQQAHAFYMNASLFGKKVTSTNRDDFDTTPCHVGKHLRRVGKSFHTYDMDKDFGVWLGQHHSKFVVGIKAPDGTLTHCETFDSLDELKREWELD